MRSRNSSNRKIDVVWRSQRYELPAAVDEESRGGLGVYMVNAELFLVGLHVA